ncbi:MAG: efflux RND transporter periplasmic adaptor subunit [Phycisphaerales bacterium]|nr:efflux RND transporter periplasmic adaptor subunit [Phycisphaerales bacterium]
MPRPRASGKGPVVNRSRGWIVKSLVAFAFTAAVVGLMLWLVGAFRPKIAVEGAGAAAGRPLGSGRAVEVEARTLPLEETAVGEIQSARRVEVASRLLAPVIEVNVAAGQHVSEGEVLVRLDDNDLQARLAQAEASMAQAQTALDQARIEESRLRHAFEQSAVGQIEMDRATTALRSAEAGVARARQFENEARTVLAYATIRSPIEGIVVDKRVNAGDTVVPGQVVASLFDPTQMQLVASVRESLSRRLVVGGQVTVRIDVLEHACSGKVSEIVPEAETASRTFQVKVTGPCPEGVYEGMFGRLSIPVGEETVVVVPAAAVRTVGQVDFVDVLVNGLRQRRAVRIGRTIGDEREILSGLRPGEQVVVDDRIGMSDNGARP